MQIIDIETGKEPDHLLKSVVTENFPDPLREIYPGTIIQQDGVPILVYGKLEANWGALVNRIRRYKFSSNRRITNLLENGKSTENESSVHFGFTPPSGIFVRPAAACVFNSKYPKTYALLKELGNELCHQMIKHHRDLAQRFNLRVQKTIQSQWMIPNTMFTQGVINNANNLRYHYDRDNVPGGWSAMVYFKDGVRGGNLVVPSLGCKFMCEDHAYMLFDGQAHVHGVTPIIRTKPGAYRYSIVYYARESMVGLGTYEEEIRKSEQVELRKHKKRLGK